jgi:hypothetical protein
MAALIQPDVCRFTVNGTYQGNAVAMIFDMRITDINIGISRDEAIQDQAEDLLHAYDDNLLVRQVTEFVATSVSWVDLDSEDGSTGSVVSGGGDTWPKAGTVTAAGMPGNVSALITKVAPGGGRRTRNGRTYWPGIGENATLDGAVNTIDAAVLAVWNPAWEQFTSDISNTNLGEGYESNLVVVHTTNVGTPTNPNIVATGYSDVTAVFVQPLLATQRRRLRR